MNIKHQMLTKIPNNWQRFLHLRHLQAWKDLTEDLKNDKLAKEKKIKCKNHLFFIVGLPKSGTTWLEQLLIHTPGLIQLNKSVLRKYPKFIKLPNDHDVVPRMLTCAPKDKLSFLKLHLTPNEKNIEILEKLNVKPIILIRDLRDMLISRYHHIISSPNHWSYKQIKELPQDKQLLASIKSISPNSISIIDYYINWITDWWDYSQKNKQNSLLIKYEDMKKDLPSVLRKIYNFYEYQITNEERGQAQEIIKIIDNQKKHHEKDKQNQLNKNLNKKGRLTSTFRKGKTGEWKNIFNKETTDFIKQKAGEMLIKTKYEENFDW